MTELPAPEPQPRKSMLPFVLIGVVLLALGIGLAVWQVTDDEDDGPNYEADCRMIEEEAPEFGDEFRVLMDASLDRDTRVEAAHSAADQFQAIADQLSDRAFAEDLSNAADAMHEAGDALERQELSAAFEQVSTLTGFLQPFTAWLDEHCPRWLGPGQWGEPGSTPTGDPSLPTGVPSLPTDFPSLPSDFPSIPDLPTLPAPEGE